MPYVLTSDVAGTHPAAMAVGSFASRTVTATENDFALNEVFGWLHRMAYYSAAHLTDSLVPGEVARMLGGARTDRLVALARKAGLITVAPRRRNEPVQYKLIEDRELFHIRTRAEIEWDRQRKRDNANPRLTMPVKRRDGDACRYCGHPVYWNNRSGKGRGGTYDHREPGKPATVETLVVCCQECNSTRGKDPAADERLPLRPVPAVPFYSPYSATQLSRWFGETIEPTGSTSTTTSAASAATAPPASPQPASPRSTTREPAASEPPQHHLDPVEPPRPGPRSTTSDPDPAAPPTTSTTSSTSQTSSTAQQKTRDEAAVTRRQHTPTAAEPAATDLQTSATTSSEPVSGQGRAGQGRAPTPTPSPATPAPTPARRPRGRRGKGAPSGGSR